MAPNAAEQDHRPIDNVRLEGVYVNWAYYPDPDGRGHSAKLFTIERVNGNCRVDSVGCTIEEAKEIMRRLRIGIQGF